MATIPDNYDFKLQFGLRVFDTSIVKIMSKMFAYLDEYSQNGRDRSVFPTIIGVDVDYNGNENTVPHIRSFMKQLRKVHQHNFVRFVTETLWAMESDNDDIFYAHDGQREDRCDAMLTLRVIDAEKALVEVGLRHSRNHERHSLLADLSSGMKQFLPSGIIGMNDDRIHQIMNSLYTKTYRLYQAGYLFEPLHIVILPTRSGNGFYPVALYGMSYDDARRRHRRISSQVKIQQHKYGHIFTDKITPQSLLYLLLHSVQDNDNFGIRQKAVKDTYALSELIFSYWATFKETYETNHDIIMFNILDHETETVDVYRLPMHATPKA